MNLTIIAYLAAAATVFGGGFGTDCLNSAIRMACSFFFKVCRMSIFRSVKVSDVLNTSVNVYDGPEAIVSLANTKDSALIVAKRRFQVLHVLSFSRLSKVAYSVVCWIAVYVVDKVFRPVSINKKPSRTMSRDMVFIDLQYHIPPGNTASSTPNESVFTWVGQPCKDSSFPVVVKKFAQSLCGKIGLSHDAPCKRIGQKPIRVISTSRLRHFNGLLTRCLA